MLPRLWIVTTALLFLASCILCTNPGLKVRVTQKALDYGRRVGIGVLQQKLREIQIPNMSGKVNVVIIGDIEYSVKSIRIYKLGLPQSTLKFSAGRGIQLSITNGFIGVKGDFSVQKFIFQMSGSFDVSVSRLSISQKIGMTRDSTGRPALQSVACSTNVGKVDFKFTKRNRWLYNLFRKFLEEPIRKALTKQMCPKISSALRGLEKNLKTMESMLFYILPHSAIAFQKLSQDARFKINPFAEVDYSLVNQIQISNNAMDLDFKGQFYRVGKNKDPPFKPPPISLPSQSNRMLYLGISDFLANSAGFVYYEAGVLQMKITDKMIPTTSPVRLNTKFFNQIAPGLQKLYPNMPIEMRLRATRSPILQAAKKHINVQAFGALDVCAVQPNSTLASLFVLNIQASVSARVRIAQMKLIGSLQLNSLTLTLGRSNVGPVRVADLELIMNIAVKSVVLPGVNGKYVMETVWDFHGKNG
ncbi:bactericidal permeability-increasing protein-like [Amblyraja radiata]|uniref:bactericidal permeability-increasing protein-like n=1 Tax=Amblyraja radiata TaxID=386614 RepID=UPI001403877B|nr:bactericidal permeability-increasing protein-like [Amblyraja radiata]